MDAEGFRARLLAGLQGTAADDALSVNPITMPLGNGTGSNHVQLQWTATTVDTDLGIKIRLKQQVALRATLVSGEGLRALLKGLVDECNALERECEACDDEALHLHRELDELDSATINARLSSAGSVAEETRRREGFLELLNRKKRRIAHLDALLESDFQGEDDGNQSDHYVERGGDDDDEGEELAATQQGAGQESASRRGQAPEARGHARGGGAPSNTTHPQQAADSHAQQAADGEDLFDLL